MNDVCASKNFYALPKLRKSFASLILAHSENWRKLLIKETLLVQNHKRSLNIDKISVPLYLFNT